MVKGTIAGRFALLSPISLAPVSKRMKISIKGPRVQLPGDSQPAGCSVNIPVSTGPDLTSRPVFLIKACIFMQALQDRGRYHDALG